MRGMLPPYERLTYQIHIPCRSKGVSPTAGVSNWPAPPGSAEAVAGICAIETINVEIARSTRRSPGATMLLTFTWTSNTVGRQGCDLKSSMSTAVPRLQDALQRQRPTIVATVIVERTENPQWLSNAYLVADEVSGKGVLIDGNDDLGPLLERAEKDGIEITHVLLTHPHLDHVAGVAEARERLGGARLVAHEDAAGEVDQEVDESIGDGSQIETGGLRIEAIYTPGHASGHVAYLVNGSDVFTGDVLFKGTVGGTMAPGASGLDEVGAESCTVWGQEATLKLWAPDYDGGNKAWVLFRESGEEAIVGGSQVERDA